MNQTLRQSLTSLVALGLLSLAGTAAAADNVFFTASAGPDSSPDSAQGVDVWTVNLNTGGSYFNTTALAGGQTGQWTIWGNGNHNLTTATHVFTGGPFTDGQTVSLDYAHGDNIDAGYTVGIRLLDAAGTVQAEFSFLGGGSAFNAYDTGSGVFTPTSKAYDSKDLFTVSYTFGSGGTNYTAAAGPGFNSWGSSATWSGTVTNPIAQIQVFTTGGWNSDQFFNNLQVTTAGQCPTIFLGLAPTPLLLNAASTNAIVASGGVAPYSYALAGGTLPAGLSLSPAGQLSGTPTAAGLSTFSVQATDANGCRGTNTFRLRVYTTGTDDSGNYSAGGWNGNGGTGFGSWSFYINNHGVDYAGAERTTSGDADIHVADGSAWKLYAINFETNLQWEESIAYRTFSSPLQVSNDLFSVSMEFQNGNNGVGAPGQLGFALRNGNLTGSGNQSAGARLAVYWTGGSNNLVVADAAGARDSSVPASLGAAYDFTVRLTSGSTYELTITPYTNGAGAMAAPVILTGALSGSGTIDSLALFSWKNSTNSGCNSDVLFNRLGYSSANFVCPAITLGSLGNALVGSNYSFPISAAGGLQPYTFALAGGSSLPPGLSLSSAGVVSGTPTAVGTYSFVVVATDNHNCTGTRTYNLTVNGTGFDSSSNYSSWGDGTGAGAGFGPWSIYYNYHGEGYCGYAKATAGANIASADGSVWELYAINFSSDLHQEEATAYRALNVPLSVAGDNLSLSFQNGVIGNPGQVGFALRNGDITGSNSTIQNGSNNRAAHARLQVYFAGGSSNLIVEDAAGPHAISAVGFTTYGCDVKVTLTSADTYSLSVVRYSGLGAASAPVAVTGTLAGSGPIDSVALFTWKNSTDNGANGDALFNNLGYTSSTQLMTNNVTFQVDMTAQIFAGNFNPATDAVEVRGDFLNWAGVTLTNNPGLAGNAANVYSGVVPVVGATNSGESYKFVYVTGSGAVWESSSAKTSTPDTGGDNYNRFFQLPAAANLVLPVVMFSDVQMDDYLPVATSVTFSVNMNGAVTTDGHTFDATAGDTVWVNGQFIPWYPYYDPANPTYGPSQYQLSPVGGGIYSVTVTIPAGKQLLLDYKYGVGEASLGDLGPRDNEAPWGQDHYRVIRSTVGGAYTLPQDTFGKQLREPFFSSTSRSDGQLTVGTAAGGQVAVSWLGRPGAHLQSAATPKGPWADQWNTDGTNWNSGLSTTNGLLSVTNWPATGMTFFRLVKP